MCATCSHAHTGVSSQLNVEYRGATNCNQLPNELRVIQTNLKVSKSHCYKIMLFCNFVVCLEMACTNQTSLLSMGFFCQVQFCRYVICGLYISGQKLYLPFIQFNLFLYTISVKFTCNVNC